MYILSPKQISKADSATIKKQNITSTKLMERAATCCFKWVDKQLQNNPVKIQIFCGIGNNGGDGLVIARHLFQHGYDVNCYVVNFSKKRSDDFLINYNRLKELCEWPVIISNEEDFPEIRKTDLVIDAIFGNGLTRSPKGFTKKLIQYINGLNLLTLAIDFPSGMYGNKSVEDPKAVLKANHVLTFQTPKLAFFLPENKTYLDSWEVINIGLDEDFIKSLKPKIHYTLKPDIHNIYKFRNKWSHKGTYGHSLLVGGSFGKIGAITLAAKAALNAGSGLVSAYIPKCGYNILQIALPEIMVEVDDEKELDYFNITTNAAVIGIGPGMGMHEKTITGFKTFLQKNKLPLVIDADAINIIGKNPDFLDFIPKDSVFTPHPKELERLIGKWDNDYHKIEKIQSFSKKHNCILVLKGTYTMIIKNEEVYINSTGNAGLATAGSGDTLTGIITGLIAQQYTPLNAAILGVYLHGKTAEIGSIDLGLEAFTASDIITYLPDAFLTIYDNDEVEEVNKFENKKNPST